MPMKNGVGSPEWENPDDAPELTEADMDDVEIFEGNTFIRRGRGRPPTGNAKELISVRLDPDVVAKLREVGPGWQTQINTLLRQGLGFSTTGGGNIVQIPESCTPIDVEEQMVGYGATTGTTTGIAAGIMASSSMTDTTAITGTMATTGMTGYAAPTADPAGDAGKMQLSQEQLAVGKRGGTRIRRYVVETPVQENVALHEERVTLERNPVPDDRPIPDGSLSEKTIEMTESAEEAVVSKTARVVEEVGLRKEATDDVESIRDTVRKKEVEIE